MRTEIKTNTTSSTPSRARAVNSTLSLLLTQVINTITEPNQQLELCDTPIEIQYWNGKENPERAEATLTLKAYGKDDQAIKPAYTERPARNFRPGNIVFHRETGSPGQVIASVVAGQRPVVLMFVQNEKTKQLKLHPQEQLYHATQFSEIGRELNELTKKSYYYDYDIEMFVDANRTNNKLTIKDALWVIQNIKHQREVPF